MPLPLMRLAARVFSEPLAIQPTKLEVIVKAIGPRLLGMPMDDSEETRMTRKASAVDKDGITCIDISGTLVSRASGMDALSGLATYADIRADFDAAMEDPRCKGIMLSIDSPGGEVQGMFELADAMYQARGQKPICAFASCAASAAYMLASCADKIVVSPIGITGSIGVIAMHLDESKADEKAGLKYTAIYAGSRKNDGNPHFPLSDDALAEMQGRVDTVYGMFVSAIARNRGLPEKAIRGQQAAIFMGQHGVAAGLADIIGTEEDARAMLLRPSGQRAKQMQMSAITTSAASAAENTQETKMAEEKKVTAAADVPVVAAVATEEVDIDALVATARNAGFDAAAEIADLCALSGAPDKANAYISARTAPKVVRAELLNAKAEAQKKATVDPAVMPGVDAAAKPQVGKAKPWKEVLQSMGLAKREK